MKGGSHVKARAAAVVAIGIIQQPKCQLQGLTKTKFIGTIICLNKGNGLKENETYR